VKKIEINQLPRLKVLDEDIENKWLFDNKFSFKYLPKNLKKIPKQMEEEEVYEKAFQNEVKEEV